MNVAIVGFETEGKLNYAYWRAKGADITICDQDPDKVIPAGVPSQLGEGYLHDLDRFDVIVRTAGLNPDLILAANANVKDKITTAVNEFLQVCPTKNVIGVTGTKGKGTTSTLIAKMLGAAGKQVYLGGNIGVSPIQFLPKLTPDSWVVLELSSFQLSDLQHSPHIGVCLMVVPEHLNWHTNVEDYIRAKSNLFVHQTAKDVAIYFADNDTSHRIASASPGAKIPFFAEPGAYVAERSIIIDGQQVCGVDDLQLLGEHNWQNVCAAVTAAWQVTQDVGTIRSVATTFAGLPHRLEYVRDVEHVSYYNDSFAATPQAAVAAMSAIPGKKVMILGGFDRGLDLTPLVEGAKQQAGDLRKVLLIGQSGQRLAAALDTAGFHNYTLSDAKTMDEVVQAAKGLAQSGDSVVLSPGFSSFDMFKNFEERGELFKKTVGAL